MVLLNYNRIYHRICHPEVPQHYIENRPIGALFHIRGKIYFLQDFLYDISGISFLIPLCLHEHFPDLL